MAWLIKFHSSIKSLQVRICRITIYYIKEILPIIKAILQNIRGGAIKRLDRYEQGTLSSLYICFKPYSHVSSDFLTHYFETSKWHQGISEIAVEGARNHGLLNVGIQDFFETMHCLPQNLLEQEKIAKFLNLIEERITTQNKIIEDLKKLKSAIVDRLYSSINGETYSFHQLFEVANEKNKNLSIRVFFLLAKNLV